MSAQGGACSHTRWAFRPEDAPFFASGGEYWVGVRETTVEARESDSRAGRWGGIPVTVWYPALNADCVEERFTYERDEFGSASWLSSLFPRDGRAILEAAPDAEGGPYPLVIYVHGIWSHRWGAQYLAEHLAARGFVVMAPVMEDNAVLLRLYPGLVSRPQDVTRLIDHAVELTAADGPLAGTIDTERIAVIGHSGGAMTALEAAGAQYNFGQEKQYCESTTHWLGSIVCGDLIPHERQIAERAGVEPPLDGLLPSFADPRVDAVVAMAPGQSYGQEGLTHVNVPTMLMVGSDDEAVGADGVKFIYDNIKSDEKGLVVFENAGHGLFMVSCENPPFTRSTSCNYDLVWDTDHAHDLINHFVSVFLEVYLKGNASARRFLQPGRVDFPGIDFEGTVASQ